MNLQGYVQDATVMLAAAVVERSVDLIRDGWIKHAWVKMIEGKTPVAFCILGAFDQAIEEMMPKASFAPEAREQVKEMAIAFVLDEAEEQTRVKTSSIPGWNDSGERTHEEVISVMEAAASRLWDISLEGNEKFADLSKFVSAAAQRGAGMRPELTLNDNN